MRRHLPSPQFHSSNCLPSICSSFTLPLVAAPPSPSPSIETSDRLVEGKIGAEDIGNFLAADQLTSILPPAQQSRCNDGVGRVASLWIWISVSINSQRLRG
ncbi:unnamed protein product [Linum trigynum]|uniref:Uncharacterized protein n=1 Tax=Linum trigynum TaxID=586398 RepID=A0AAV2FWX8_9ROSI